MIKWFSNRTAYQCYATRLAEWAPVGHGIRRHYTVIMMLLGTRTKSYITPFNLSIIWIHEPRIVGPVKTIFANSLPRYYVVLGSYLFRIIIGNNTESETLWLGSIISDTAHLRDGQGRDLRVPIRAVECVITGSHNGGLLLLI